jgi:putative ABC transport system substrate-binding protein
VKRRRLILAAFALPFANAGAQPVVKQRRIGLLLPNTPEIAGRNPRVAALLRGLREAGWVEGQNIVIERRFAMGQLGRLDELAAELVRDKVDLIVTAAAPSALAAKAATTRIPIVMLDPGDPVGLGLVASLARPGANITGVSSIAPELAAKRLALLKEISPGVTRIAVLSSAGIPPAEIAMAELTKVEKTLGLRVLSVPANGAKGLDDAFRSITQGRCDGLLVFPDPLTFSNQDRIVQFASEHRIAAMYGAREFVEAGGLLSYGPSYPEMFRRGAYYVDRILKGARPADLPVELPAIFELAVNLKCARALGLTVPPTVLVSADRVIER